MNWKVWAISGYFVDISRICRPYSRDCSKVELLAKVIEAETGSRPEYSTAGGTSDARFVAQYCPVVELGLPGPTMPKVDECVPLADVRALTALYAAFITRFVEQG